MSRLPKLSLNFTYGASGFRRRMEEIIRGINFGELSDDVISAGTFLDLREKLSRRYLAGFRRRLMDFPTDRRVIAEMQLLTRFCHLLGDHIYSKLDSAECDAFFPDNHIWILPDEGGFSIISSGMKSETTCKGRVVFSSLHRQIVSICGTPYRVKFAVPHVTTRIQERLVTENGSYGARQRVHAFLSNLVYFCVEKLRNGEPAVVLFDRCSMPVDTHYDIYMGGVLRNGDNGLRSEGDYYFRAAYCPIDISDGKCCILKTCLFPGFSQTPEAELLESSRLPSVEKNRLRSMARDGSAAALLERGEIDSIRWFHDNGIPQVVRIDEKVFCY